MRQPLRVLATGFAPGFVIVAYIRPTSSSRAGKRYGRWCPAGTVLFAAGQTAIAATPIRTGWHVIGKTAFQNFDPSSSPPTRLTAGDEVSFVEAA